MRSVQGASTTPVAVGEENDPEVPCQPHLGDLPDDNAVVSSLHLPALLGLLWLLNLFSAPAVLSHGADVTSSSSCTYVQLFWKVCKRGESAEARKRLN